MNELLPHGERRNRRLIEVMLPLKEISEQASKEKSIRHGNINTIHLWWARRPIIAARAAVYGSLINYESDSLEAHFKFVKELCTWEAMNNKSLINKAKKKILENYKNIKPKVLDCFAGGGSIPLEAHRLGCESYALDLNPVAHLVEMCTIAYPTIYKNKYENRTLFTGQKGKYKSRLANDIYFLGKDILKEVEQEIGEFYPKKDGNNLVAYLWARVIRCPNPSCSCELPLIKNFILADRNGKVIFVEPVIKEKRLSFLIKESSSKKTKVSDNLKRGSVCCFSCGQTITSAQLREFGSKKEIKEKLFAAVYQDKGNKVYLHPTDNDYELFETAASKLCTLEKLRLQNEMFLVPDEKLPEAGTLGFRIPRYGFSKWRDVYNSRQLLAIVSFIRKINQKIDSLEEKDTDMYRTKILITYMSLAMDRLASYATNLSLWSSKGEFIGQLFSQGQAIPMRWDYAEVNPFSDSTGNWSGALDWICRVVDECSNIDNEISEDQIVQGSALNLPFKPDYFDAIIIDPPYYDAVPYSDLSDFFYILLKRNLFKLYPKLFNTPLTPKSNEIIQEPKRHGGQEASKKFFETKLTDSFKEANRVLKEEGIFLVVFAHKSTSAWETLVNSLLNSGFVVTSSWPIITERPGRLRSHNSAALASSIFIVCRKRKSEEEGYFNEVKDELKQKIKFKLDQFWSQGIRGADFFISAIGPAVEVFGKYKNVMKLTGEEVLVAELLDLVREIVTDYSLHKILKAGQMSNVDEETRFYLLWRWAYDDNDVPYDDARKLAQALGAEIDNLVTKGDILQKKGDKVNLMEPWERKKNTHLGESKGGIPAPMIDVIHRACLLWEKGEKQELGEFIEASGYSSDDTIWNVAQAISEVLPDGNKEKQLIQGLLASKQSISKDIGKSGKQGKLGEYLK